MEFLFKRNYFLEILNVGPYGNGLSHHIQPGEFGTYVVSIFHINIQDSFFGSEKTLKILTNDHTSGKYQLKM